MPLDWHSMNDADNNRNKLKIVALTLIAAVAGFLLWQYGDLLSLESLAARESQLRDFQAKNPYLVYGVAFLVYVVVTGLSLPGAAALTLVYGWYFGFFRGVVLVSFASTAGATIAFLDDPLPASR